MELSHLSAKLEKLDPLLLDPTTIEIALNADGRIWLERVGDTEMKLCDELQLDPQMVDDLARNIANKQNLTLTQAEPKISTSLTYRNVALRCQAIIPPAASGGTVISFRAFRQRSQDQEPKSFKFLREQGRSLEDERREKLRVLEGLVQNGQDPDKFLRGCVDERLNVIISGQTSSGKTELSRRLLWMVAETERLALIEDSEELLPLQKNVVSLISERMAKSPRSADQLLEATLRLRPDRIILGELRGVEAMTFLEAINTGHEGSFTTVHAQSARKAIERLAMMGLRSGFQMTFSEIARYVSNSIDVIIQTGRIGSERGILEVYFPALDEATVT